LALIIDLQPYFIVATAADLDVTVSSFTFSVGGSAEIAGGYHLEVWIPPLPEEVTGAAVSVNSTGQLYLERL
jgi:hypothetical protein